MLDIVPPPVPKPSKSREPSGAHVTLPARETVYRPSFRSFAVIPRIPWETIFGMNILLLVVGCAVVAAFIALNVVVVTKLLVSKDSIVANANQAFAHFQEARTALSTMDFARSTQEFNLAQQSLESAQAELNSVLRSRWGTGYILNVSRTVRSARHILTTGIHLASVGKDLSQSLTPLSQIVVFANNSQEAQITLVRILGNAKIQMADITREVDLALYHIKKVNVSILPANLRAQWDSLEKNIEAAHKSFLTFLDHSDLLLSLLGADGERHYLIVFQNNHEIRPTGGFIGSVALVRVDQGVVEAVDVQSVYDPDGQLGEYIEPPKPLGKITPRFFMRDANWFVDYKTSAQKIAAFLEKEKGPTVDGVIAMTPEVIRQLLTVSGPIDMPAYGVTVTPENFVTLTQQQVTYNYNREINRPKQFLADVTPLLLNRLFQQPTQSAGPLIATVTTMLEEKNILLYFPNETLQSTIEDVGWGGRLKENDNILYVNNANIGGHKSDQFMTQDISYKGSVNPDDTQDVTVTIRRTHHGPTEGINQHYQQDENPVWKDNVIFQRIFVPPTAELVEVSGTTPSNAIPQLVEPERDIVFVKDSDVDAWQRAQTQAPQGSIVGYEEDHKYFAHWVVTKPGETSVVQYRYRVTDCNCTPTLLRPYGSFNIHIVKQPGDMRTQYEMQVTLPESYHVNQAATLGQFTAASPYAFLSKGELTHDAFLGLMYEKK